MDIAIAIYMTYNLHFYINTDLNTIQVGFETADGYKI